MFVSLINLLTLYGMHSGTPQSAYVYQVPKEAFQFDIEKIAQTYQLYHENHPGLTLVIGHPFEDQNFLRRILEEQRLIKEIFQEYLLDQYLHLYEPEQIHATVIELAVQHDSENIDQKNPSKKELTQSKTGKSLNLNFSATWIKKTKPFQVELGPSVLSEEHREQSIRIISNGQIVMKGRAKERKLLAKIRGEFEDQSNIIHKYGREDDEFFFVIGYLSPSTDLNNPFFIEKLITHLEKRRKVIQISMNVSEVSMILYQQRTLSPSKCLKQWNFQLGKEAPVTDFLQMVIQESSNKT